MKTYTMSDNPQTADINVIKKLIPHAYPFLLVDKIVEMNGDEYGIGVNNVTINEKIYNNYISHSFLINFNSSYGSLQ